ncbi:TetR/AcrR family transcriptional regulator [Myceligenerans pegani]|uniref:TetR/AcrR family transcriptional regulator C-terminal domain-containing protein n=1 Tax=Myceligenerans pegani TaxID=2776917 RepID=A0ABR9MW81_9MICO|nr:TetR/AcrR family transcriptional regulator [Myceligenerans sp. TRM 65318]MBE1875644.1 TetR/AcrR family transcriptional regulator C-terminal domain-containing protein [Myceligenerans sp. TRM 65318]MBE3017915.1 TetR/AcrR family transcriptional regulator C-terminal domain-containing protein [Myceligenerans sp. TRM 65318]
MTDTPKPTTAAPARQRLSRERVLAAALAIADRGGLPRLTIRSLASELGARPMSVYHYVSGKEELLDALVDAVFEAIDSPDPDGDWREEISRSARSARAVLREHSWAIGLLESRTSPGPATLRHHDRVLACLLRSGFSPELTAHAYALVDSYVYGFALQEASLPFDGPDTVGGVAEPIMERMGAGEYPAMVEMATTHYLRPGYDWADEFDFGLELILDGLERRRS